MMKLLLNFMLCEPLSLVQEFPYFDNLAELEILLVSSLNQCVHDSINGKLFHVVRVKVCSFQLLFHY